MRFADHDYMVLLDVETTGIDHEKDLLLELSAIVVDKDLNEVDVLDSYVIHHDRDKVNQIIDANDDRIGRPVVREMHEATGLLTRVDESLIELHHVHEAVETALLDRYFGAGVKNILMVGNSVRFDLDFLRVNAPQLHARFNKRIVDVSGIFELINFLKPDLLSEFVPAPGDHNSLNDLRACLNQLRYVKQVFDWSQDGLNAFLETKRER